MKRMIRWIWLFFYKKFSVTTPVTCGVICMPPTAPEGGTFFVDGWLLY